MTQQPPPPSGHQPWQGQNQQQIPPQPGYEAPSGYGQQQPGYGPPPSYGQSSGYGVQPGQQGTGPGRADGEERTMMLLAHLSAPLSYLFSVGTLPFLGPLLIWLFYKDRSQAVRIASAGAFNFNVSVTIATWVTIISIFITLFVGLIWGVPILIALFILQVWAHVRGAIKASNGETYDYPFQIRILS